MQTISRRRFLRRAVAAGIAVSVPHLALAAPALARGPGMGGGGGGGGGGGDVVVIDPPVGDAYRNPQLLANESADPAVFAAHLEAKRASVNVNGRTANLVTYNGQLPGPMIRVRTDQLLRLDFTNRLPDDGVTNFLGHNTRITNIHTHGLHVSPGMNANGTQADNMMVMLPPGTAQRYEYDLTRHAAGNLNFYHPHIHGSVTDQMWGGLSGPLLVEDGVDSLRSYEEKVLVIKDITLVGSEPARHDSMMDYMHGVEGDTVLVNGMVNPRLDIAPGQVQRWRVLNACTARFLRLGLAGHSMFLVGTDGGLLDRPYQLSELLLSPGERADLLVRADQKASSYKLLSLPYSRGGMSARQQVTLLTMRYTGSRRREALPSAVDPSAARVQMDVSSLPRKQIELTMGHGSVGINGITYTDHEHCFMTHSMPGTWEVWEITNASGMDHPFHHHTNSAQVLSISGGDTGYASLYTTIPAWKDVTVVPKMGKVELLMPVMDYDGMAMLHCHIIEHEDIGMMGVWHIMGDMPAM